MAIENFTTYTEVDGGTCLSVAAAKVTVSGMLGADASYLYKDMGANHFNGDFEHLVTLYPDSVPDLAINYFWGLANAVGEVGTWGAADYFEISCQYSGGARKCVMYKNDSGGATNDTYSGVNEDTSYYWKFKRDESVGDFGTLYGYVYSDAARTNLLDTLSLVLAEKTDLQYVYASSSLNNAAYTSAWSGYVENLDLQEAASYNEAAAVAIGLAVAATRLVDATRTATTAIGLSVASAFGKIIHSAAVAIGLSVSASRTAEFARTATVAIGHAVTASRLTEIAKTATTAIGLSVTATRTAEFTRTAAVAIGHKVTASRVPTFVRTASVAVGLSIWANCTLIARVSVKTVKLMGLRSIDFIIKKRDAKSGVSKKDVEIGL